ncbi:voltage and ligand gated potassium channel [Holotrichia oblita]|uniref:Voltage and ligand gated potassium channel n=1 Tax=Holotrichia oblita TaxID=644536 RepID=A0ACB9TQ87_HOLOL|nr:voltage and ligand gated potassium channel [Holotrichia oblita]
MPYHTDKRLAIACNRSSARDYGVEKSGWRSILLLQFQTQFRAAIILGILVGYFIVTYEAAYIMGLSKADVQVKVYMTGFKERLTGKGFGNIEQHQNYIQTVARIGMTVISFFAYFILGYNTSTLICGLISRDATTYGFLRNVATIQRAILDWKSHNKRSWKNYHNSLYNTCLLYFKIIWSKRDCSQSRTLVEEIIPKIMFKEIYLDISWNALKHSHLFKDEDTHFLRKTAELIKHRFFAPGEIIYRQRLCKTAMVYVTTGTIQILSKENGETPIMLLSSGTCIGESTLVFSYHSHWTVACKTYCELEVLEKADFVKLGIIYPEIFRKLTSRIRARYHRAKQYHRALKLQWKRYKIDNPNILTLTFIKRTLHRLLNNSYRNEGAVAEWNESCAFQVFYLDMYAICEETEAEVDSIFLRKDFPVIFHHSSIFLDLWRLTTAIVSLLIAILYPFYVYNCGSISATQHFIIYISITSLWSLDVYIQASTSVKMKHTKLTTLSSILYYKLSKPSFLIDLVSILPIALFLLFLKGHDSYQSLILFEIHKLFKVHKMKYLYSKIVKLNLSNLIVLRYIQAFVVTFFLFYYTAMIFYCLICNDIKGCSIRYLIKLGVSTKLNVTRKSDIILHLYSLASFFLVDIQFLDFFQVLEKQQTILIIILQMVYTLFTISILAFMAIVETLNEKEHYRYKEFIINMENVMKDFKVNAINQKRIRLFLMNNYLLNKGIMVLNPDMFVNNLSMNLYSLYRHVLYGTFLRNIPLFQGLDEKIIIEAVGLLKVTSFPPGEVITYANEVCKEMHVIEFGYCVMKLPKQKTLGRTHSFCVIETCLQIPTFYTVVTVTDCSILSLDYRAYSQICNKYPEFRKTIDSTLSIFADETHMVAIREQSDHTAEENIFDLEQKIVSIKRFIFDKSQRMLKRTQFDIEFISTKSLFKYMLLRYTFTSYGRVLLMWEIFRCCFALIANVIPSFTRLCSNCRTFYIILAIDATAWLDIYVRHHVCYFNKIGVEVSHPMRTAIHYWKNALLTDILGSIPIDYFVEDKYKKFLRFNRIIQMYRPFGFIKYLNAANMSRSRAFEIAKYMPITLLLVNYVSSFNMYMTCDLEASNRTSLKYSCAATNWLYDYIEGGERNISRAQIHTAALLLATVTLSSVGLGKISVERKFELFTYCLMILIGHIFFVWIAARMVADNFYRKSNLTSYQEAMKQLLKFVSYRKVDKNIKKEIIHYFEYMWFKTRGTELKSLISSFNTAIKEDILYDIFGRTLQESSIFPNVGRSFVKSLLPGATYEVYLNRGIIYRVNDIHGFFFFILKGTVQILGPDYNKLQLIPSGSIFGNLDNCPLTRQTLMMVAKGNVELLKMNSTYFYTVLSKYPSLHKNFKILTAFNIDFIENYNVQVEVEKPDVSIYDIQQSSELPTHKNKLHRIHNFYLKISKVYNETIYNQIWDMFVLIVVCYIGFHINMILIALGKPPGLAHIFIYGIEAIYIIHMYLQFHTSYKDEFGVPVRSRILIARNYLKRPIGFYLDLVSVLPTEIICFFLLKVFI